jgi:hypothetical protein
MAVVTTTTQPPLAATTTTTTTRVPPPIPIGNLTCPDEAPADTGCAPNPTRLRCLVLD